MTIRTKTPDQLIENAKPSDRPQVHADKEVEMIVMAEEQVAILAAYMQDMADNARKQGKTAPRIEAYAEELRDMVVVLNECIIVIRDARAKALRQH